MANLFEYADQEIGMKELAFTVASTIIGVGILTLPRVVALQTRSSGGMFSILIAGAIALFFGLVLARLVRRFHHQTFFQYASLLTSKSVAYVLTALLAVYFIFYCAYEVRAIATISKFYLFDRTPVELIALAFLLVVIYAVSGSRVGIIRLNVLFLPIVLIVTVSMLFISMGLFEFENLPPFFISSGVQVMKGAKEASLSFLGFEVVLFYAALMNKPKDITKAVVAGISIPLLLYLLIFIFTIGIFSWSGTINLMYPTVEIAKEIQIPGEFFERFESLFFVIWIMTIFNTTCMAMDITIQCLTPLASKIKKKRWILITAPVIYALCMLPQDNVEFTFLGSVISFAGVGVAVILPIVLLVAARVRGVKVNG